MLILKRTYIWLKQTLILLFLYSYSIMYIHINIENLLISHVNLILKSIIQSCVLQHHNQH